MKKKKKRSYEPKTLLSFHTHVPSRGLYTVLLEVGLVGGEPASEVPESNLEDKYTSVYCINNTNTRAVMLRLGMTSSILFLRDMRTKQYNFMY